MEPRERKIADEAPSPEGEGAVPRLLLPRGRGATLNPPARFERVRREPIVPDWLDPGWNEDGGTEYVPPPLRTEVAIDAAKHVITYNQSPDIGFDRSINPYRGCEHGCVYCFARPTHAYYGLSPGLDFEAKLFAKPDAAAVLENELAQPRYACRPIAMGTNTDPYQPVERGFRVTRSILEVLARYDHPLTIVTKSALILRDLDILAPMAAKGLVRVAISVTTLDRDLARRMEPRAAAPAKRLAAIRRLAAAGVPTGVMVAPIIPALNDHEIEAILAAAKDAGASGAAFVMLRLPHELKELVADWLKTHVPLKAERVLALVREMRGGKLNDAQFGTRMRGQGNYATMIRQRFVVAARRLGLEREMPPPDTTKFRPPAPRKQQLSLF
jgi:DNA repair photolyase